MSVILFFQLHRYFFSLVDVRLLLAIFFIARIDVVVVVVVAIVTGKPIHIFLCVVSSKKTTFPHKKLNQKLSRGFRI